MRRDWEPEELIACWTLVDDDWRLAILGPLLASAAAAFLSP